MAPEWSRPQKTGGAGLGGVCAPTGEAAEDGGHKSPTGEISYHRESYISIGKVFHQNYRKIGNCFFNSTMIR